MGQGFTSYAYDPQGRLVNLTSSYFDTPTPVLTLAYDKNGNVISRTSPDGTIETYNYDQDNRLIWQTLPGGGGSEYTYDQLGNRTSEADIRFTDDFNSGTLNAGWTSLSNPSPWQQASGVLSASSSAGTVLTRDVQPNTDYTFQARIKMIQGSDVGLVFRYQDDGNYYLVRASGFDGGYTTFWKRQNGALTKLASYAMGAVPALGSWYTLRVQVQGSAVSWRYQTDGYQSQVYTATDTTFGSGRVGFRVGNGGYNSDQFDDALASAIPTAYVYDAASELTEIIKPDSTTVGYAYDQDGNRLSSTLEPLFSDGLTGPLSSSWNSLSGAWALDTNGLTNTTTAGQSLISRSAQGNDSYTFQGRIYMDTGRDVGLVFHIQKNNQNQDDYYLVRASGLDPSATTLWKVVGGAPYQIASYATGNIPAMGSWYTLKVMVQGASISWCYFANGYWTGVFAASDNSVGGPALTGGGVGFRVVGGTAHFDNASLSTPQTYVYNGLNRLLQVKDGAGNVIRNFSYDAAGNQISEGTGYRLYDERNRLTESAGAGTTSPTVIYTYDALGSLLTRSTRSNIFTDDFSSGTGNWTTSNASEWSNPMDTGSNGTLVYRASSTVRTEAWRSGVSEADLTYSARVKITGANSASVNAGLIFRSSGYPTLDQNEYYLSLWPSLKDSAGNPAPMWRLYSKTANGNFIVIASGSKPLVLNRYYTLTAKAGGATLQVYLDGALLATVTDASLSSGQVGLRLAYGTANFDDVRLDGAGPTTAATTYRYNDATGALMEELDASGSVKSSVKILGLVLRVRRLPRAS